jgi:hypothetical protein
MPFNKGKTGKDNCHAQSRKPGKWGLFTLRILLLLALPSSLQADATAPCNVGSGDSLSTKCGVNATATATGSTALGASASATALDSTSLGLFQRQALVTQRL